MLEHFNQNLDLQQAGRPELYLRFWAFPLRNLHDLIFKNSVSIIEMTVYNVKCRCEMLLHCEKLHSESLLQVLINKTDID